MIDVSKLLFVQYHLPEIDLNDPEVMEFLMEVATKANEDREKNHDKRMAWYREKISKICSSVEDLQEACLEREQKNVAALYKEVAFYKAVALYTQVQLDVARQIIKERGLKKPERTLRIVK